MKINRLTIRLFLFLVVVGLTACDNHKLPSDIAPINDDPNSQPKVETIPLEIEKELRNLGIKFRVAFFIGDERTFVISNTVDQVDPESIRIDIKKRGPVNAVAHLNSKSSPVCTEVNSNGLTLVVCDNGNDPF